MLFSLNLVVQVIPLFHTRGYSPVSDQLTKDMYWKLCPCTNMELPDNNFIQNENVYVAHVAGNMPNRNVRKLVFLFFLFFVFVTNFYRKEIIFLSDCTSKRDHRMSRLKSFSNRKLKQWVVSIIFTTYGMRVWNSETVSNSFYLKIVRRDCRKIYWRKQKW